MAEMGDIYKVSDKIIALLKENNRLTRCISCGGTTGVTTAGTGDIPVGLERFTVTKTDAPGTPTVITMSDGSTYALTAQNESFTQTATQGGVLPDYSIAGGTWKWHGIKNS